jgi:hypothetical protein
MLLFGYRCDEKEKRNVLATKREEQYAMKCAGDQESKQICLCGLPNVLQPMIAERHDSRNEYLAAIDRVPIDT